MPIYDLGSDKDRRFIDKLRRHRDGVGEYNRTNVKKRLEYLADGGDIRELEGYEDFTGEKSYNGTKIDMLLVADAKINFIESPDPGRCLLFLAGPVCTALIMEEYDLAKRLLKYYPLEKREFIKIFDENHMRVIMNTENPYGEEMDWVTHWIAVEAFLVDVWEKIGDEIKPFWDSFEKAKPDGFRRKSIVQLPTLFGAYRHNKVYMDFAEAGIPRDADEAESIIDTKYDGSRLLEYLKKLSEYSRILFKYYIRECSFEFGQLTPEAEFKLKLAIQKFAVNYLAGDEDGLMELVLNDCLEFELPRYQPEMANPNKEILLKHIKYCGKYYKANKRLKDAFFHIMIRYFTERHVVGNACDWPELEKYAGEFFDEDFQIMDSAVLRRKYGGCLEYTQVYTKIAKGRHFYHVNTDKRLKVKYMISMFSQLDERPLNADSRWTRPSNLGERLYDIIFWLEDMETAEIDMPDGGLSHGWRDLDFVDTQAVGDNLETSVDKLMLLDACDRYFCLLAFIWKMICQTGDAELFTIAYKKGFIPESQIGFSLEKYGNGEFKWNKSLVPVMLGIAEGGDSRIRNDKD